MSERTFVVLVERKGRQPLGYPACDGVRALACMERLAGRGHRVAALTSSKHADEELGIEEMRSLYGDEQVCADARERAQAGRAGQLELAL